MAATNLAPFNPSTRVLLGPGPSEVPPRVLAAMGYPCSATSTPSSSP